VPERVVAQLVPAACEVLHLLHAPLGALPLDPLVAEEGVPLGGAREHAEDGAALPFGMPRRERLPHTERGGGIDDEGVAALQEAELPGRRIVEGDHHRREAGPHVDAPLDELAHGDGAIAARMEQLEVLGEALPVPRPAALALADQVVLEDGDHAEAVRRARGRGRRGGLGSERGRERHQHEQRTGGLQHARNLTGALHLAVRVALAGCACCAPSRRGPCAISRAPRRAPARRTRGRACRDAWCRDVRSRPR
jgi:hypothetical protein